MKSEWSTQITRKIVILQQNIDKIVISYFQVQNKNEPKEKEKEKKPETHRRSRLENISITLLNDRVISSDIGISSNLFQQQFHFIFFQFISSYIKKKKKKCASISQKIHLASRKMLKIIMHQRLKNMINVKLLQYPVNMCNQFDYFSTYFLICFLLHFRCFFFSVRG